MLGVRKYLFTSRKISYKGIVSAIAGFISLLSFFVILSIVLGAGGNADARMGAAGCVSLLFSAAGFGIGIYSLTEKETFRFFPWLGTVISFLALVFWGGVVYVGFAGVPW